MSSSKNMDLAGVNVVVTEPEGTAPTGIVLLLGGAMVTISSYGNITNRLVVERNNVVLGMYFNVFTTSHTTFAEQAHNVFLAYLEQTSFSFPPDQRYGLVSHSAGGKVSLVLATQKDEPITNVVAFDPVDGNPVNFTNTTPSDNLSFAETPALSITMTWASGTSGFSIPVQRNASKIHASVGATSSKVQPLVTNEGANHMAYTDNKGGIAGWIMFGGDKEFSAVADSVYELLDANF